MVFTTVFTSFYDSGYRKFEPTHVRFSPKKLRGEICLDKDVEPRSTVNGRTDKKKLFSCTEVDLMRFDIYKLNSGCLWSQNRLVEKALYFLSLI